MLPVANSLATDGELRTEASLPAFDLERPDLADRNFRRIPLSEWFRMPDDDSAWLLNNSQRLSKGATGRGVPVSLRLFTKPAVKRGWSSVRIARAVDALTHRGVLRPCVLGDAATVQLRYRPIASDCRLVQTPKFTPRELSGFVVKDFEGQPCAYCGVTLTRKSITIDHVIPRSRGGADSIQNYLVCCRLCNESKRDRTPAEWARDILRHCPERRWRLVRPIGRLAGSVVAYLMVAIRMNGRRALRNARIDRSTGRITPLEQVLPGG